METKYRVTVFLDNVRAEEDDDAVREAVKHAMVEAIEQDDNGEQELQFDITEVED